MQETNTADHRSTTVVDSGTEAGLEENTLVDESDTKSNDGPDASGLPVKPISEVAEITLPVTAEIDPSVSELQHLANSSQVDQWFILVMVPNC